MNSILRAIAVTALVLCTLLCGQSASALPIFARQTQQNCVACHVGGQYPELTPYGRYFKLTGYTQGDNNAKINEGIGLPISMSIQAGQNTMANNQDSNGNDIDNRNGTFSPDQVSLYAGGRISDNVGLFAQWTCAYDQGNQSDCTFGSDNFDLRYADHNASDKNKDIVWGLSLNNDPGLTDVFNSTPSFAFPFQYSASGSGATPPVLTQLESYGGGSAVGLNAYVYFNKNYVSCEIARKRFKSHRNFIVIGLKWNGKNVKRRTIGFAKEFVNSNKNAKCIYCETKLTEEKFLI